MKAGNFVGMKKFILLKEKSRDAEKAIVVNSSIRSDS
jgi:hypothetical protein